MRRSAGVIDYHGRKGRPIIHMADSGKRYIMVRAKGGGVKRLYEGSKYTDGEGRAHRLRL